VSRQRIASHRVYIPLQVSDFLGETTDRAVHGSDAHLHLLDVGSGVGRRRRERGEGLVSRKLVKGALVLLWRIALGLAMLGLRGPGY
jgi:hypothetical protein